MNLRLTSTVGSLMLLIGCISHPTIIQPSPGEEHYQPPIAESYPIHASNGSLFRGGQSVTLFTDRRAYQVGDILMIVLDETTQGEKSANTEFSKQSEVDIPTPTLGNLNTSEFNANIQGNRSFDGGATSSQANTMSGIISVMVHRVMPNGVLEVRGEKWISLNQGDEFIRVTGFIRSEDIDSENRVLSNRLADARISYAGTGELADANEAGWLSQLINSPWFPL